MARCELTMITPFVFSTLMAMLNMISVYGVSCRMNTEAAAATLGVYNPFQPSFYHQYRGTLGN